MFVTTINYNKKRQYPFMGQRNRLRERVALSKAVTGKTGYEEVAGQTPISVIQRSNLSDPYIRDRLDFEFYYLVL
jgi:hypothetical protein